jgi:hypothetical protein
MEIINQNRIGHTKAFIVMPLKVARRALDSWMPGTHSLWPNVHENPHKYAFLTPFLRNYVPEEGTIHKLVAGATQRLQRIMEMKEEWVSTYHC